LFLRCGRVPEGNKNVDLAFGSPSTEKFAVASAALKPTTLADRIAALGPWFQNMELDGTWAAPEHFLQLSGVQVPGLRGRSARRGGQVRGRYRL